MTSDATREDTVIAPAAATDEPVEQISEKQFGVAWFYSKRFKLPRDRASLTVLAALVPPRLRRIRSGRQGMDLADRQRPDSDC